MLINALAVIIKLLGYTFRTNAYKRRPERSHKMQGEALWLAGQRQGQGRWGETLLVDQFDQPMDVEPIFC